MASRETFNQEEWNTLLQAPLSAGMAVVFTSGTGPLQAVLEVGAVAKALASDNDNSGNGLIRALRTAVKAGEKPPQTARPENIEQARSQALEQLRRTAALVNTKAPEDATGFKEWLSAIALRVAEAAKEGSFLGIGGTQVTDEERAAIADVDRALGGPGEMDASPAQSTPDAPDTPNFGDTIST